MLVSPFSTVMGYSSPDGKGIYLKPTSEAAPDGWGEPRMDTTGATPVPIIPGTPGGPLERCLLRRKGSSYKASATKYFQKSGNITWWGDWRNPAKQVKGKHVLSYNGPKLRYFRDEGFNYGSDSSHNEIYYLGNFATIAPGPVLGACLRKINFYDPIAQKTAEETFIIVAVYQDGMDKFYKKRWPFRLKTPYNMSDAVREKEMRLYDAAEEPYGWIPMGTFAKPVDAYPPETPWFFNQSGTAAVAMRRTKQTFNNGYEDVTEDKFVRLKADVSDSNVSVSDLGNLAPLQYLEKYSKEHPTYVSTDILDYDHSWQEDHVKVTISLDGAQYVLCDYVGDTLYWGKVKYQIIRIQEGYYTKGTDPAQYVITYNGQDKNISNLGLRFGPRVHNNIEYGYVDPVPYVPAPADHEVTWWISVYEKVTLYYGPEGNEESGSIDLHYYDNGTSDEWAGNPRQQNNPYLYYYQFYTRHLRGFCDLRNMAFFSRDLHKYGLWQNSTATVSQTEKFKDTLYTEGNSSGEDKRSVKKTKTGTSEFGWPYTDMEQWAATFNITLSRTTYVATWPAGNYQGEIQKPGAKTFYAGDTTGDHAANWPSISDLLYGPVNQCKGNGVRTEQDSLAYSVEVPDVENEGSYVIISDTKPAGDPAALVGYGTKFYPIGSC